MSLLEKITLCYFTDNEDSLDEQMRGRNNAWKEKNVQFLEYGGGCMTLPFAKIHQIIHMDDSI